MEHVNQLIMRATNLQLQSTLAQTLVELSRYKGIDDLEWVSQIEYQAIQELKNFVIEGSDESMQIKIIDDALALLKMTFEAARVEIVRAAKDK